MVGYSKSISALASRPCFKKKKSSAKTSKNSIPQIGLGKMKKKRKKVVTIEKKKSKKRRPVH